MRKTRRLVLENLEGRELMAADATAAVSLAAPQVESASMPVMIVGPKYELSAIQSTAPAKGPTAGAADAVFAELGAPSSKSAASPTVVAAKNDTFATAENIGALTGRSVTRTGSVGSNDLRDYWKFTLSRTQTVTIRLSGLAADIDVALYDASGRELTSGSAGGTTSEAIARVLGSGTYYVKVYPGVTGASSNYRMSLNAFDPGNDVRSGATDFGTVKQTTITKTGSVGTNDPWDYWKFTPDINGFSLTGRIGVSITLCGMSQDLDLYVYDGNGNVIARSQAGGTASERLSLTLQQGGQYYVLVKNYNLSVASDYRLTISTV
jgi:hypothetical protein